VPTITVYHEILHLFTILNFGTGINSMLPDENDMRSKTFGVFELFGQWVNNSADDPGAALSADAVSGLLGTSMGDASPHFSLDDFLDDRAVDLFLSGAASIDGFRLAPR
jgi:hypothetical protein